VPLPTISASTKAVPELYRRESPRRESRGVPQRHLAIRPWRTSDAPALSAAIAESVEHLRPWMSWIATEPRSLAERESMIAWWEEERRAGGDMVFGMFTGAAVVGGCGLHRRLGTMDSRLAIGFMPRTCAEGMPLARLRCSRRWRFHSPRLNWSRSTVIGRIPLVRVCRASSGSSSLASRRSPFRHRVKPGCRTCGG
jgi:hypothetical protein